MKRKTMKKTGVAVLTMAMLLSMGAMATPVFAAEGGAKTVQISSPALTTVTGATFYKVAELDDTGAWQWIGNFTNNQKFETLEKATAITLNNLARSLKSKIGNAEPVSATKGTFADGVAYTLDITGKGYYLIIPTVDDNSVVVQPSLVEIDSTGEQPTSVMTKANPLPLNKYIVSTVQGETAQDDGKSKTSVGIIGSKIEYSIESTLPEYASDVDSAKIKPFILTDDPSDGIDITISSVKVFVDQNEVTDNEKIHVAAAGEDGFTVTVDGSFIKPADNENAVNYEGKDIVVTFDAVVSGDAVFGNQHCTDDEGIHTRTIDDEEVELYGNPNTVTLTWGNNFSTGEYAYPSDHTPTTPEEPDVPDTPQVEKKDSVTTYVGKIELNKVGESNGSVVPLSGAKFTLTGLTDAGDTIAKNYTTANGKFDFGYLPAGAYTLTETQAPTNYKVFGQSYTFTVTTRDPEADTIDFTTYEVQPEMEEVDTSLVPVEVDNVVFQHVNGNVANATITVTDPLADELPATGGIGTYVFTFGGAAIVLLAGVLFVIYMKKRKAEEE